MARIKNLSGFSLGEDSPLAKQKAAESAYRASTRAAAKTGRIAGRTIGGDKLTTAQRARMSAEEIEAAAQEIQAERRRVGISEMKKIKATKGDQAHKKATLLFDLYGNKAERRRLRKELEGKESGTNLTTAADALSVSREKLEEWMSEGTKVEIVNDGLVKF
ncbi:MAG: hypothetical protein J6S05_07445 [Bacteroidaceae bacterium]|nr:hypothetical protein [Bacteroidaceae bacterium]